MVGPNRADRIALARARVVELEPEYLRIKNAYEDAIGAVRRAEQSYDVGERVEVTRTCRRGCCIEWQYTGIVETASEGRYSVRRDDDGGLSEHVFDSDMARARP